MNRIIQICIVIAGILSLDSCSVKENRNICPCTLLVDASQFKEYDDEVCIDVYGQSENYRRGIDFGTGLTSTEFKVKREMNMVVVYGGLNRSTESDGEVHIPYGEQASPLRVYHAAVDCEGSDLQEIKAIANRQSALVHLKVINGTEGKYPYSLTVVGDISGINLRTLRPIEGKFKYELDIDKNNECQFRLPRLTDESKPIIEIGDIDYFPLYSWIQKTGYDWAEDDLKDIYITIDHSVTEVTVSINGWDESTRYEVHL